MANSSPFCAKNRSAPILLPMVLYIGTHCVPSACYLYSAAQASICHSLLPSNVILCLNDLLLSFSLGLAANYGFAQMVTIPQIPGQRLVIILVAAAMAVLFSHIGAIDLNWQRSNYDLDCKISLQEKKFFDMVLSVAIVGEEPVQLLWPGKGHNRLELIVLKKIATTEDLVSIVGVVGVYHYGKSFILNVLLNSIDEFRGEA